MKIRTALIAVGLAAALSVPAFAQDNEDVPEFGNLLFQVGVGIGSVSYPGTLDDDLQALDDLGYDRTTVGLNLNLGLALNEKTYVLFGVYGVGDRIASGSDYMQINTYLYQIGVRYYPFLRGLYGQVGVGSSSMVTQFESPYVSATGVSDTGSGFGAAVGYSFGGARGFGLGLELAYTHITINSESVNSAALTLDLCWK